jgi:hypothetical protein
MMAILNREKTGKRRLGLELTRKMMHRILRTLLIVVPAVSFSYCYGMEEKQPFLPEKHTGETDERSIKERYLSLGRKYELQEQDVQLFADLKINRPLFFNGPDGRVLPGKKVKRLFEIKNAKNIDLFQAQALLCQKYERLTIEQIRKKLCSYYENGDINGIKDVIVKTRKQFKREEYGLRFVKTCLEKACWCYKEQNSGDLVEFFVKEQKVLLNEPGRFGSALYSPYLLTAVAIGNLPMVQALVKHDAVIDPDTMFHLGMAIRLKTLVGGCLGCVGCKKDLCKNLREVKEYLVVEKERQTKEAKQLYQTKLQ